MRTVALAPLFLLIAACSPPEVYVTNVRAPDGSPGYSVVCDAAAECTQEASKICGKRGYVVHTNNTEVGTGVLGHVESMTTMLVSCRSGP
jgi:hypothetical protein